MGSLLGRLRNSVLYLIVAVLILAQCEWMLFHQVRRGMPLVNLLAALVLAVPLLWGLVQRRTLQRWEETENISAAAAFQEKRNDAGMVLGTYGIVFMVLSITA